MKKRKAETTHTFRLQTNGGSCHPVRMADNKKPSKNPAAVALGRKLFHAIPPGCLRDGANSKEIDYGVCVLRLR